jgi:citrate synthase
VREAERSSPDEAIRARLAEGRVLIAFGHPLYPHGDPRAGALLERLRPPPIYGALARSAERLIGELPNVDFALAAMTATERLPADAPFILFALARTVGWIAHALEQRQSATLLRPRARYIGPPIPEGPAVVAGRRAD